MFWFRSEGVIVLLLLKFIDCKNSYKILNFRSRDKRRWLICLFEDGNANSQIRVYSVRDLCILSNTLLLLLDHVNCCTGVDFLLL